MEHNIQLFSKFLKRKGSNPSVKKVEVTKSLHVNGYGLLVTYKKRPEEVEQIKRALSKIELAILLADNLRNFLSQ